MAPTVSSTIWYIEHCLGNVPAPGCEQMKEPEGAEHVTAHLGSIAPTVQAVTITCLVLVYIATAIRVFTRTHLLKTFTFEDVLMIIASIGTAILVILLLESTRYGLGKHLSDTDLADSWKALRLLYAVQIVYGVSIFAAKIAVLLQIKRLFTGSKKSFTYWATWVVIGIVTCAYIAVVAIWIFPCNPIKKFWKPQIVGGHCNPERGRLSGTVNILSDVAILILPIAAILKLHMCLQKKLGVCAVFIIAIIACAASVIRLYYTFVAVRDPRDSTYWFAIIGNCATAELAAVILCGCLPSFPQFFKHITSRRTRWEAYELGYTTTARSRTDVETGGSTKNSCTITNRSQQSV